MGWFPVIEHVTGRVLSLLDEQMFFHIFNAFLTLWNTGRKQICPVSLDFVPTLDLLWSNIQAAKEHLGNTIQTLLPISEVFKVNQNAAALLEQLLHSF